jgi:uncharacterized protein (TIGR02453 family)
VWPPEALVFLRELEENNDRDWFKANRGRYDRDLLEPARRLAAELSELGEPRFFRPYNNLRFRPGPPLKEHIAMSIGGNAAASFYVQLSLDGLLVGAGLFHPAPDQLERFRAAIDDERRGRGFGRAIEAADAAGMTIIPPALKRAPKGFPVDHPRIEWLRMKNLVVHDRHELGRWLHTRRAVERVATQLEASRPLVKWLGDNVGPSTQPRPR